ncbi:MAG: thiosulfate oxidation carrier complex protein SoxZ [Gammaproteobacteria bacterium]|nr:thiosulfate oxidation carrier complex protein SoxZ [Gammaproteobacteria bacterium]
MARTLKIRAHEIDGQVVVKSVINHPMETGQRKIKKTGRKIPAHFIKEVVVSRNRKIVMEAFWGKSISRNPYLSFQIPGRKGDTITISWLDNRGNSDTASAKVR